MLCCLQDGLFLIFAICVCLRIVVSLSCVVFLLCLSSPCAPYVVINCCDSMWSFWVESNMWMFFIFSYYMYWCWRSNHQDGRVDSINQFSHATWYCLSQARSWISNVIYVLHVNKYWHDRKRWEKSCKMTILSYFITWHFGHVIRSQINAPNYTKSKQTLTQ
jgi:hypothetical protein